VLLVRLNHADAVYSTSIPTFTLTLVSDGKEAPRKGYLTIFREDVESYLNGFLESGFNEIDSSYRNTMVSLRTKEISSNRLRTSILIEGLMFFDSDSIPEYLKVKELVLSAFSKEESKEIFLKTLALSTDNFFKEVEDVLFSFGVVSEKNAEDSLLHKMSIEWVTIIVGCTVGVVFGVLCGSCYLLINNRRKTKHDLKDYDTAKDSISLTDQQTGQSNQSNSEKSNSLVLTIEKDDLSQFHYSVKSIGSEEVSGFAYDKVCAPTLSKSDTNSSSSKGIRKEGEGDVTMDILKNISEGNEPNDICDDENKLSLSNMEVQIRNDLDSPKSQITQYSFAQQKESFVSPSALPAIHNNCPDEYLETDPTPLKNNVSLLLAREEKNVISVIDEGSKESSSSCDQQKPDIIESIL